MSSRILNDDYRLCSKRSQRDHTERAFSPFNKLPAELALKIWKTSLEHRRIIGLDIIPDPNTCVAESCDHDHGEPTYVQSAVGKLISHNKYRLEITTNLVFTPLLKTCHQSRRAALEFYRIQIPDVYMHNAYTYGSGGIPKPLPLYINPEFDVIQVLELVVDFIHDMKAYDPQGHGVLNLAIGHSFQPQVILPLDPSVVEPHAISSFKDTLRSFRTVMFHQKVKRETRHMFKLNTPEIGGVNFNRSYPLYSHNSAFDLLEVDPRSIDADLEHISLGYDPRWMLHQWREMERAFDIQYVNQPDFQYFITAETFTYRPQGPRIPVSISTREEAGRFLDYEQQAVYASGYTVNPETPETIKNAPLSVFGFWLFELDAFGEIMPEEPAQRHSSVAEDEWDSFRWDSKMLVDVRKHRPQLGVFHLVDV